ncbi:type VI secretion protein IcmF/TssM N-terminal domain-containing protein [Geomonas ferrireducens]|uniref:type VI secretion protein IcmF/TssM N-terminal domain-containing protein n=1 Tax=Geomonas ferrireducens TaxID=2570227 RepID=UPI0010A8E7EF|nr:type VI secretion protein IcmF/TssM N-terminal domain-containing protein [Geomonas ferrireducens]
MYTLLNCCKYVLFIAALLPMTVIVLVMFPVLTWPWRIGILMPFIALFLWGMLEMVRRVLQKRSEETPKERAPSLPGELTPADRDRLWDLQQSWRSAIGVLKRSNLKQEGDPLHVLPWYLVLGESGSGKTSAVRGAHLFSPFSEAQGDGTATANCTWHFYDQGIVVDTAGRYAVPLDTTDRDEWLAFLALLKKYRHAEAVNGVIMTVAADKLAAGASEDLEDQGRELRCRLDEMIRLLGITFPVYLLITRCDLIDGMSEFCGKLPEASLFQPMGLAKLDPGEEPSAFVDRLLVALDERLRTLRLLLLQGGNASGWNGRRLLFPDRLRGLRSGLDIFMRAAFASNHYQETPRLRGIYLCSARHGADGALPSAASDAQGGDSGGRRGLFLHDFFEKVLPRDRGLWAPSARSAKWRHTSDNLVLACCLVFGVSLCLLLTGSFMKNLTVLRNAAPLAVTAPQLRGEPAADSAVLERMRRAIVEVEQENRGWWVPRFGLTRSLDAEQTLKSLYCRSFRDHILNGADAGLVAAVASLSPNTPDEVVGTCIIHLCRRCNLLKERLESEEDETADVASQRPPLAWPQRFAPPDAEKLYLAYVAWRTDQGGITHERQWLQQLLKQAAIARNNDFSWLLDYVNREEAGAALSLKEFWHGSRTAAGEPGIMPVFTRRGSETLRRLLDEICTAYPDAGALDAMRTDFLHRHRQASFQAWQDFAVSLPLGEQRLLAPGEWQNTAAVMAGEQGPYFSFMRRVLNEIEPLGNEALPSWVTELYRFQALRSAGPAGVASFTGQVSRVAGAMGRSGDKISGFSGNNEGVNLAKEYLNAVAQVAPVAKSRALAHKMALQAFTDASDAGKSPLFQAADAAQKLNRLLIQGGDDDTFYRLLFGPITFYGTYIRMETACVLQSQWEQTVLKEVQGSAGAQTLQYLLGKDGPVWKYVGDYANPFIGWSPARGYYPKSALGGSIPFRPEFYSFLARGGKVRLASIAPPPKAVYQVTIKGLPTDANPEARIKPQGTRLELNCATGSQVISNMNYPVSKPFIWTPEACGEVVFQIEVGDTVLTRRYPGSDGFAAFLRDFPGGRHTFRPRDFPHDKAALERMGIRFIRVNYRLFGADGIASPKEDSLPARVPARIAECWD